MLMNESLFKELVFNSTYFVLVYITTLPGPTGYADGGVGFGYEIVPGNPGAPGKPGVPG